MREEDLDSVLKMSIFESLPRGETERLVRAMPVQDFDAGRHVYTPAYRGRMFFLLLRGRVRTYRMEGPREITLATIYASEVFGEAAFTSRERKGSYAQAMRPCRVGMLNDNIFRRFVERNPHVGLKVVEHLCERLSLYEERLASVGLKAVPLRLAGLIVELTQKEGVVTPDGYSIPTRYSHEQLGAMIGAERVAVTRALTGLRQSGAVEVRQRRIHVSDMDVLRQAAS